MAPKEESHADSGTADGDDEEGQPCSFADMGVGDVDRIKGESKRKRQKKVVAPQCSSHVPCFFRAQGCHTQMQISIDAVASSFVVSV